MIQYLRESLKIHFVGQANLFDSGRRQIKAALALTKADLSFLPEYKKLLLAAGKQLLELPLTIVIIENFKKVVHRVCFEQSSKHFRPFSYRP